MTMPCFAASSITEACSVASIPPSTMTSGFEAIACCRPLDRPATEPWPSISRKVQPIFSAASLTPSPAPRAPPFRWSVET